MSPYGNVDDRTHFKSKVRNASWACRGVVFSAALPYCAASLTDGVLHPDFVRDHVVGRGAKRAWREAIEAGFVHTADTICGRCSQRLHEEMTDPLPADGEHYLHDYLEHNPSKRETHERRKGARDRQAAKRDRDKQAVLPWAEPEPLSRVSHTPPRPGVEGRSTEATTENGGGHSRTHPHRGPVDDVIAILAAAPRFQVTAEMADSGIQSAINANPGKDPSVAAHAAVAMVSDPAFRMTSPVRVFMLALEKQPEGTRPAGTSGQNVQPLDRTCSVCKVAKVEPGMGAQCEACAERLAS